LPFSEAASETLAFLLCPVSITIGSNFTTEKRIGGYKMYKKNNKHDSKDMYSPESEKSVKHGYTCEGESSDTDTTLYRFTNYIEKVVIHAKIDYVRHQQLIDDHEEMADEMQEIIEQRCSYSLEDDLSVEAIKAVTLDQIATSEKLYDAIGVLSSAEKEVLYHIFVEERSTKETAELMRRCCSWTLRIKKRALKKLYEILNAKENF
jgi:DNA-directed RNA polymerase specialized sigma24 family protein